MADTKRRNHVLTRRTRRYFRRTTDGAPYQTEWRAALARARNNLVRPNMATWTRRADGTEA